MGEREMQCPNCSEVLRRIEYEGMPVCTCPGCNGEFLDGKKLKYIERKQEIQFDKSERNRLFYGKTGPSKERRLICPRCGNHMSKGRYRKTEVVIDHCKSCSGVWLDDQELEKIQILGEAGKTGDAARADNRPELAEAVTGARAVAREKPGESTAEQGFAAAVSAEEMSVSVPRLWVRLLAAALFMALFAVWAFDLIAPDRIVDGTNLENADRAVLAALVLLAALVAFSFRKITIRPDRGLEVKRYVLGIPITREYARKELKCIGTDFSRSYFSGGGLLSMLIEMWLFGYFWLYWRVASGSKISGLSYLYVVLKSGKRILIYRGRNDELLGDFADILQSGLKLQVRRL